MVGDESVRAASEGGNVSDYVDHNQLLYSSTTNPALAWLVVLQCCIQPLFANHVPAWPAMSPAMMRNVCSLAEVGHSSVTTAYDGCDERQSV